MKILREDTAALLIDVQDRLIQAVHNADEIVSLTTRLIRGLHILEVPIIPVRQYPKGLGDYPPEIRDALGAYTVSDKTTFSAWETQEIAQRIQSLGRKNLLVFGMESHVCILQTVIDLASNGYHAVVVADCVGSRKPSDHEISLYRAEEEGAILTTSEAILFELLRKAGTDTFKQISALVK